MLTIAGVGGLGLIAGTDLAVGILLGAGVDALLRRQKPHETAAEEEHPHVRRLSDAIRDRARAVIAAARGQQTKQQAATHEVAAQQAAMQETTTQPQTPQQRTETAPDEAQRSSDASAPF
jgi:hypothetical protein